MAKQIQSVCNYCGVGCNIVYHQNDDGIVEKVTGAKEYPVNKGVLCPKGFKIHEPILSDERGKYPLVKKNGTLQRASWDEAIGTFTDKVKDLQEKHGKQSVAFISTGQMVTEGMSMLGQVGRTGMGMHGDGNTRQCMASAVVGYKKSFGFDSPPMTYKDIEASDCIVLIGSNMPIAHPIVWNRIKKNPNNPDIVVIDPRRADAGKKASLHLPIQPKKDLIFLYMVMNKLIANNWIDKAYIDAHTNGFDDMKEVVSQYDSSDVEKMTGITSADFDAFVDLMHERERVTIWWTMGVNQSHMGTRTVQAIINLCLITGNIGKLGAGPCSLTGQANAMGSRMFSNTTSLFGGRNFENPADREFVGKVLGLDPSRLPEKATLPYDKIIAGIEEGSIKGLWIVFTNPMHSWINNKKLQKIIANLELLVVQDIYSSTLSAEYADIFFPAAGIGEVEGFLINSERRLSIAQKAMDPPGEALSDFEIFQRIAKSYGCEDVIKGWDTPADVFQILKRTSEGMPCDITGIRDYQHIAEKEGIQWPYPKDNPDETQERRLFEDGVFFTPDGKAKLEAEPFVDTTNANLSAEYPLYLLTGRGSIVQYQSNTRTSKSAILHKQVSESVYVEINQKDADALNVSDGDSVKISSLSHTIQAVAKITDSVFKGYVFLPFHYPETNNVVESENFDAYSRQPSFKTGAVKIEAA